MYTSKMKWKKCPYNYEKFGFYYMKHFMWFLNRISSPFQINITWHLHISILELKTLRKSCVNSIGKYIIFWKKKKLRITEN